MSHWTSRCFRLLDQGRLNPSGLIVFDHDEYGLSCRVVSCRVVSSCLVVWQSGHLAKISNNVGTAGQGFKNQLYDYSQTWRRLYLSAF